MERDYTDIPPHRREPITRLIEWMEGDGAEPLGRFCEWALVLFAILGVTTVLALGHDRTYDPDIASSTAASSTAAGSTAACARSPSAG